MTKAHDTIEELVGEVVDSATAGLVPPPANGTFSPFRYPVFRAIWIANPVSYTHLTLPTIYSV